MSDQVRSSQLPPPTVAPVMHEPSVAFRRMNQPSNHTITHKTYTTHTESNSLSHTQKSKRFEPVWPWLVSRSFGVWQVRPTIPAQTVHIQHRANSLTLTHLHSHSHAHSHTHAHADETANLFAGDEQEGSVARGRDRRPSRHSRAARYHQQHQHNKHTPKERCE